MSYELDEEALAAVCGLAIATARRDRESYRLLLDAALGADPALGAEEMVDAAVHLAAGLAASYVDGVNADRVLIAMAMRIAARRGPS